jgi:hypothetical protein
MPIKVKMAEAIRAEIKNNTALSQPYLISGVGSVFIFCLSFILITPLSKIYVLVINIVIDLKTYPHPLLLKREGADLTNYRSSQNPASLSSQERG